MSLLGRRTRRPGAGGPLLGLVGALLALAGPARPAAAAPSLVVALLPRDAEAETIDLLVATHSPLPDRPRLGADVKVLLGADAQPPLARRPFLDHAAARAREDALWRPPVAIGLVYLWAEGAPPEITAGWSRLAKRLPARSFVLPTLVGQVLPTAPLPTPVERIIGGALDDQAQLPGDHVDFLGAVRANLRALSRDESALRALVIVADGRDYKKGEDPGSFAALGREIASAGVLAQIVGVPETDRDAGLRNLRALARAAGAPLALARDRGQLPTLIEATGTLFFDAAVLTVRLPWWKRRLGGPLEVVVEASLGGQPVRSPPARLELPRSDLTGLLAAAFAVVLLAGLIVAVAARLGRRARPDAFEALFDDLQEMVRRKLPVERAAAELSRRHPSTVVELAVMESDDLDPERYRLLRSRAGQARVREIAAALDEGHVASNPAAAEGLLGVLASCLAAGRGATECARAIRAQVPDQQWSAFARSGFAEFTAFLKGAAARHAELRSPRARAFLLAVQDALRKDDRRQGAVVVAWLVRSAGPGRRGETLPVPLPRAVIGASPDCDVRLPETGAARHHAALRQEGGAFLVEPLEGPIRVEGESVTAPRPLVDGDTLDVGRGQFVFKAVADG